MSLYQIICYFNNLSYGQLGQNCYKMNSNQKFNSGG